MGKHRCVGWSVVMVLLTLGAMAASGQKLNVKIINRQDSETTYNYQVPGHSLSNTTANANCFGNSATANCSGTSTTSGFTTAARDVAFTVTGATFSLLLPDGRIAIVNCVSKFKERMAGPAGNHRSCRQPLVDSIEADFHGNKAKLKWPVSLDGKKFESETYNIIAVLPAK